MPFNPLPKNEIRIGDSIFQFTEHPNAPGRLYGQEGRRATVYQLTSSYNRPFALKVFKPSFRVPRMVAVADKLAPYASLAGLQACKRTVLTSKRHPDLLSQNPELTYAVLMPWVDGETWQEILLSHRELSCQTSLKIAQAFVSILVDMEERGLAHCDLSAPNIIIGSDHSVSLVDLEEMYGPDFIRPAELPAGSSGYAHQSVRDGIWREDADRFAGAVILMEMLGWCNAPVRNNAWGESYFVPDEMQRECERFRILYTVLEECWGERIAGLFSAAWHSDSLADCPNFAEWNVALISATPKAVITELDQVSETVIPVTVAVSGKSGNEDSIDLSSSQSENGLQQNQGSSIAWVCPHCHKEVTENGDICPYCERSKDEPVERAIEKSKRSWLKWLFFPVMIIAIFFMVLSLKKYARPSHLEIKQTVASLVSSATSTNISTITPAPTYTLTVTPTETPTHPPTNTIAPSSTTSPTLEIINETNLDRIVPLLKIQTNQEVVYSIDYSPDGNYLATAGRDGKVNFWRVGDGMGLTRFNGHSVKEMIEIGLQTSPVTCTPERNEV